MRTRPGDMHLTTAALASLLLAAAALTALVAAGDPTDALAIAGAVGLVLAASLFGLTLLAWRWTVRHRRYVRTSVDALARGAEAGAAHRDVA